VEKEKEIISVGDLSKLIQRCLENEYSNIYVRGEISGVTAHSSGHTYFSLKDENGVIDCICWRGSKIEVKIENGIEVVCFAKVTTYAMRSKYQLIVQKIESIGKGDLFKILENRKNKLQLEGVFNKKLPISKYPLSIGILTSPTGAVIKDIMIKLKDRLVFDVKFIPIKVQGEGADLEVCNGLKEMNRYFFEKFGQDAPSKSVIILARGGGSFEDLWTFQEENVVRAVFESKIPVISAIGHETDTTLIDFAADLRAPTPTGAAEIVAPLRSVIQIDIENISNRMHRKIKSVVDLLHARILSIQRGLGSFDYVLNRYLRIYDEKIMKLVKFFSMFLDKRKNTSDGFNIYKNLDIFIVNNRKKLQMLSDRLNIVRCEYNIQNKSQKLIYIENLLSSLSYEKVMERGFCIAEDQGKKIKSALDARKLDEFDMKFSDGAIKVKNIQK
jgi:exodeoxyribonuclease VII large subunit